MSVAGVTLFSEADSVQVHSFRGFESIHKRLPRQARLELTSEYSSNEAIQTHTLFSWCGYYGQAQSNSAERLCHC